MQDVLSYFKEWTPCMQVVRSCIQDVFTEIRGVRSYTQDEFTVIRVNSSWIKCKASVLINVIFLIKTCKYILKGVYLQRKIGFRFGVLASWLAEIIPIDLMQVMLP